MSNKFICVKKKATVFLLCAYAKFDASSPCLNSKEHHGGVLLLHVIHFLCLQLAADANTEVKPTLSSLPPSNFELLTRRLPIPLDLKKCPSEPVIVIDDLADACHYKQQTTSKQGVAAPFVQQHRAASHDHKGVGGTHVAHVVQVTTHQNTTLKKDFHFTQPKKPSYPLHQPSYKGKSSSSIISHQTSENHSDITDRIKDSDHIQVWSCHKCTWNEVNDEDDEFDELCQMVDLSDSFDDNEQVMITPDSSHTWTCPMCNEVLTGK